MARSNGIEKMSFKDLAELEVRIQVMKAQRREEARLELEADLIIAIKKAGFTVDEVFPARQGKKTRRPAAPKYRDPATGRTWAGRGRAPRWAAGKDLETLRV